MSLRRLNVEWFFSLSPYITVISNFACSCIEMSRLLLVLRRQCDSVLLWMPQFFSVDFLHVAVLPFLINSLPVEFHLRRTSSFPASVDAQPACATPCYCSGSRMTGSGADGVYCSVTGFLWFGKKIVPSRCSPEVEISLLETGSPQKLKYTVCMQFTNMKVLIKKIFTFFSSVYCIKLFFVLK